MKIKNINHVNAITFEQMDRGSVFECHDIIYMKIASIEEVNAVNINDGMLAIFCDDTMVHPVEGYFHVEKIW